MIPHKRIGEKAIALTNERQSEHKDNYLIMSRDSLAYAAMYKIERARVNTNKAKALDDLADAYNYVAALFERVSDDL